MHPHRGAHSPGEPSQTRHGPTQPSFVERVRQLRKRVVGDTCHPPGLDLDAERGLAHLGHSKPPFLSLRTSCRIAFTSDGVACHITWVDPSGPEHLALRPALDDPALPDRLAPDLSVVPGHPRVSLVYLSMDLPLEGWTHRSASLPQAMSPYGSRRDRGARPPQPGLVGRRRRRLGRARAHELGLRARLLGHLARALCPTCGPRQLGSAARDRAGVPGRVRRALPACSRRRRAPAVRRRELRPGYLRVRRRDLVRPARLDPEAARILRPGGRLVFLGHSYLAMLTFPT